MTDARKKSLCRESFEQLLDEGTFEEALAALETVVEHLERGRLPLEEAVAWYEVGLGLSRRCNDLLQSVELRIVDLEETYGLVSNKDETWDAD